jgi:hypothetical protein
MPYLRDGMTRFPNPELRTRNPELQRFSRARVRRDLIQLTSNN